MANDCLVTKLIAAADNDMLCGLNEMRFKLNAGEKFSGSMQAKTANVIVSLVKGSVTGATLPFYVGTTVGGTNYEIVASEDGTIISVKNVNNLYIANPIILNNRMSITDLQYDMPELQRIAGNKPSEAIPQLYGDLNELKDTNPIQYVQFGLPYIEGNVKYIGRLANLLQYLEDGSLDVYGDIMDIAKLARGKGRSTGSILVWFNGNNANVKFNGEIMPVFSGDRRGGQLSWTSTTITLGQTTVENSDVITE